MNRELLNELSQNNSYDDICMNYSLLEESIRHNLSARLMDTSEENPLDVNIPLESHTCGLSTLEMPTITSIFQDPCEGYICVRYEGADDYIELDDLYIEDRIQIVRDLQE